MIEKNEIEVNVSSSNNINASISGNDIINTNIEGHGPPGSNGADGADGITWIPEIEKVNTLEPNEEASASVKTEGNKMLFTFNIPKGNTGSGIGDMQKKIYDSDEDGIIDNSKHAEESDNALKLENLTLDDIKKLIEVAYIPVGTVTSYAGIYDPIGWLICDGREISREEYSSLFDTIGTSFGSGNGSTTFNIPKIAKKVIIGRSDEDHKYSIIGNEIGNETHTLTIEEIAEHDHNGVIKEDGEHCHSTWNTFSFNHSTGGVTTRSTGDSSDGRGNETDKQGNHTHEISISKTGKSKPFSIMQPSLVMNFIIKY